MYFSLYIISNTDVCRNYTAGSESLRLLCHSSECEWGHFDPTVMYISCHCNLEETTTALFDHDHFNSKCNNNKNSVMNMCTMLWWTHLLVFYLIDIFTLKLKIHHFLWSFANIIEPKKLWNLSKAEWWRVTEKLRTCSNVFLVSFWCFITK